METNYEYTFQDNEALTNEEWVMIDEKATLTESGFASEDFRKVSVNTEYGKLFVYCHKSLMNNKEQMDYIIRAEIDNHVKTNIQL